MKRLNDLKIGTRLVLGFGIILLMVVLSTVIGLQQLRNINLASRAAFDQPLLKERLITDWYRNLAGGILRTKAVARSADGGMEEVFKEDAAEATKNTELLRKKIEPLLGEGDERQLYEKIVAQRKLYLHARDSIGKMKTTGELEQAARIYENQFIPHAKSYLALVKDLVDLQRASLDSTGKDIDKQVADSQTIMVVFVIAALFLGALFSWYLARSVIQPIRMATGIALQVAEGNLTSKITVARKDEAGVLLGALKSMNDSLSRIVGEVRDGASTMNQSTQELAEGAQALSSRTEAQASSLEETSASMEELTSSVKQNAASALEAKAMALSASTIAEKGGNVVSQVIDTMNVINVSANKIVDIISTIDNIAFQTNILALNAAVEAARAGDQGRGFAVVASEVRGLAQRSAEAAKQISILIMDSVEKVELGSALVNRAGATMSEVVYSVQNVTKLVSEISMSSEEQRAGIGQINYAIAQMDHVTQQNAAMVEESAAAANIMLQRITSLSASVSQFKTD